MILISSSCQASEGKTWGREKGPRKLLERGLFHVRETPILNREGTKVFFADNGSSLDSEDPSASCAPTIVCSV